MLSLLARGMGHCGAVAVCLQIAGCSLQNFDALSSGDNAGSGGSAGSASAGAGRGGDAGSAAVAGNGGAAGAAGTSSAGSGGLGGSNGTSGTSGVGSGGGVDGTGGSNVAGNGSSGSAGSPATLLDGGVALNLLPDPSFSTGHVGWVNFGSPVLSDAPGEGRDGSQCLLAAGRTQTFEGPAVDLTTLVSAGSIYSAEAWVRTSGTTTQSVNISLKTTCAATDPVYSQVATELVPPGEWVFLGGEFSAASCELTEYKLYIEGAEVGVDMYIDDVGLFLVQ